MNDILEYNLPYVQSNFSTSNLGPTIFLKKSVNPGLFLFFRHFLITVSMIKIKKHKCCAWDSNPRLQDCRRRQNPVAMAAAQYFDNQCLKMCKIRNISAEIIWSAARLSGICLHWGVLPIQRVQSRFDTCWQRIISKSNLFLFCAKPYCALKLFNSINQTYSFCFGLGGVLDFRDFLKKALSITLTQEGFLYSSVSHFRISFITWSIMWSKRKVLQLGRQAGRYIKYSFIEAMNHLTARSSSKFVRLQFQLWNKKLTKRPY